MMKVRRYAVALATILSTLGTMAIATAPQAAAAPEGCLSMARSYHIKGTLGYPQYASVGINVLACFNRDTDTWNLTKNYEGVGRLGEALGYQVQGIVNNGPLDANHRAYDLRIIFRACPDIVVEGQCIESNEWDVHLDLVRANGAVQLNQNVTSDDGGPLDTGYQFTWD